MATVLTRSQRTAFERYYQERLTQASAVTPGQKIALVAKLRRELLEEGRIPLESGPVRVPVDHPVVRAALAGRPVAIGGKTIQVEMNLAHRLQRLGTGSKLAILLAMFLLPMLLVGWLALRGGDSTAVAAALPTGTATSTPTSTPSPTMTPEPTPTSVQTPTLVPATPTPFSIALVSGEVAPSGNDPASTELGGFSYVLSAGHVVGGVWQPSGAEWLAGTDLRRVVALPFEADLASALTMTRPGSVVRLRLRSGEVARYRVTEIARRPRQQIEVLAARAPSLAVVLHGEPSAERWVLVADAIQEPNDFSVFTVPESEGAEVAPPLPAPTLQPGQPSDTEGGRVITSTHTITSTATGLVLEVGECERAEQVGQDEPPAKDQEFLACDVTLRALDANEEPVPYSGQSLAVSEQSWVEGRLDWWPAVVPGSRAIGDGTLAPGRSTGGRVIGLVKRPEDSILGGENSQPVLLWEQAGVQYLVLLEPQS